MRIDRWIRWGAMGVWAAGFLGIGALLGAEAREAFREVRVIHEKNRRADGERRRLEAENRALRAELEALERDPIYLESLLRRWRMTGEGEIRLHP